MIRSITLAGVLGVLAGVPAFYLFTASAPPEAVPARRGDAAVERSVAGESWPICTTMDFLAEGPAWAPLDPEFAAGKRALAAGDWPAAIAALTPAALRDDRNADIQNYLGYAYRRLRQMEPALEHFRQALTLNARHRSAREHLGEAYLVISDLTKAKEQLAALEEICLIPCAEYEDLKQAIAEYNKVASR